MRDIFQSFMFCIAITIIYVSCDGEPYERWVGIWDITSGTIGWEFREGLKILFLSNNTWEIYRVTSSDSDSVWSALGVLLLHQPQGKSTTLARGEYVVHEESFDIIHTSRAGKPFDAKISGTWWRAGDFLRIWNEENDTSITLKLSQELED